MALACPVFHNLAYIDADLDAADSVNRQLMLSSSTDNICLNNLKVRASLQPFHPAQSVSALLSQRVNFLELLEEFLFKTPPC